MDDTGVNKDEINFARTFLYDMNRSNIDASRVLLLVHHRTMLAAMNGLLVEIGCPARVALIDASQGQEEDILVVFTSKGCRSAEALSFVSCAQRETVAMSRAREYLVVVGEWRHLFRTPFWKKLQPTIRNSRAMVDTRGNRIFPCWL